MGSVVLWAEMRVLQKLLKRNFEWNEFIQTLTKLYHKHTGRKLTPDVLGVCLCKNR